MGMRFRDFCLLAVSFFLTPLQIILVLASNKMVGYFSLNTKEVGNQDQIKLIKTSMHKLDSWEQELNWMGEQTY